MGKQPGMALLRDKRSFPTSTGLGELLALITLPFQSVGKILPSTLARCHVSFSTMKNASASVVAGGGVCRVRRKVHNPPILGELFCSGGVAAQLRVLASWLYITVLRRVLVATPWSAHTGTTMFTTIILLRQW